MEFEIDTAEFLKIDDIELSELLTQAYVAGGSTDPDEAVTLFEPSTVRKRGILRGGNTSIRCKISISKTWSWSPAMAAEI